MTYRLAGIDVHKKMLAVVVADIAVEGAYEFTHRRVGTSPRELRELAAWLVTQAVEEVVMESTAQYWRPVWETLERDWLPQRGGRDGASPAAGTLHLAQAQSNKGRRGRKRDFPDAERLVRRLVAQELTLSFVPDAEQRLWRTVTRRKYQLTRNRVQVHNRLEALLEEAHLKLSSLVSDLLGLSARRMLAALAEGETDPAALAALADRRLRATAEQLGQGQGFQRIINLSGNHPPRQVRLRHGDSRGQWEGDTLVIETTNFSPKFPFRGASANRTLVERYTRVDAETLAYEVTIEDPTVWVAPWTVRQTLKRQSDQENRIYYEPRCYDGNYGISAMFIGARAKEREFAEGKGPDPFSLDTTLIGYHDGRWCCGWCAVGGRAPQPELGARSRFPALSLGHRMRVSRPLQLWPSPSALDSATPKKLLPQVPPRSPDS